MRWRSQVTMVGGRVTPAALPHDAAMSAPNPHLFRACTPAAHCARRCCSRLHSSTPAYYNELLARVDDTISMSRETTESGGLVAFVLNEHSAVGLVCRDESDSLGLVKRLSLFCVSIFLSLVIATELAASHEEWGVTWFRDIVVTALFYQLLMLVSSSWPWLSVWLSQAGAAALRRVAPRTHTTFFLPLPCLWYCFPSDRWHVWRFNARR